MLKKDEIIYEICGILPQYLKGYDIEKITVTDTVKNNGVRFKGICIKPRDSVFAPNLYVDRYIDFDGLCDSGESSFSGKRRRSVLEDAAQKMVEDFKVSLIDMEEDVMAAFEDGELADRLFPALVNYEKNEELLSDCPYIRFNDLAITFRWMAFQRNDAVSSVLVNNHMQESWDISTDEMFREAVRNAVRLFPPTVRRLDDMLFDMTGVRTTHESPFYVMTNERGINGATVIVYENVLRQFSDEMDTDFYIIPSSIHEVILLPAYEDISEDEILEITRDVNENAVDREEVLSDSLYYYSRKMNTVTCISA